jgi:hypothetical protein
MMVCGCDFSTRAFDFVALELDTDEATWHRVSIDEPKLTALERARLARDRLPNRYMWRDAGFVAVCWEQPYSQNRDDIRAYGRVEGILLATLPPDLPVYTYQPSLWKKRTTGDGHASKEAAREWARDHWQGIGPPAFDALPLDATDAFCVAWIGRIDYLASKVANLELPTA